MTPSSRPGCWAAAAVLASNRLQFVEALDLGARAVAAGRSSGDEHALALGLDGLKTVYAYTGQLAELDELTSELEVLLRRAGDLFLLQWTVFERAMIPFAAGQWDQARAGVEEALVLARRSGRRGYEAWYLAHLGWIARLQGRIDDAVAHGRRSLDAPTTIHTWFQLDSVRDAGRQPARQRSGGRARGSRTPPGGRAGLRPSRAARRATGCAALRRWPSSPATLALLREADDLLASATFVPGTAWLHGLDAYLALARSAILRDMVQGERYALAAATMQSTFLAMVVAGAAVGGLTVALLGARPALGFDAATFVVSALLIKFGVLARPAAATSVPSALRQLGGGVRVVFGDRALRILLMLGWLAAFYGIPGGIAAPYAARLGGGPVAAGLLIAARS